MLLSMPPGPDCQKMLLVLMEGATQNPVARAYISRQSARFLYAINLGDW